MSTIAIIDPEVDDPCEGCGSQDPNHFTFKQVSGPAPTYVHEGACGFIETSSRRDR